MELAADLGSGLRRTYAAAWWLELRVQI